MAEHLLCKAPFQLIRPACSSPFKLAMAATGNEPAIDSLYASAGSRPRRLPAAAHLDTCCRMRPLACRKAGSSAYFWFTSPASPSDMVPHKREGWQSRWSAAAACRRPRSSGSLRVACCKNLCWLPLPRCVPPRGSALLHSARVGSATRDAGADPYACSADSTVRCECLLTS